MLATMMLAGTFTACSSDEDDSTGGNPFNDADATVVTNDQELRNAMNNGAIIKLANDIDLSNSTLSIESGTTVTINLDGHTLNRGLTARNYDTGGQVITVRKGATLHLGYGTLKGGWGGNAGGLVNEGGTANLTDVTITGCVGDDRGGGICNLEGGTLTITGGALTGNTSIDKDDPTGGGGLFNAAGATASLKGVKVSDNVANSKGGGGICNYGTLTLDSCSITGNVCGKNGGGIYNYSTATLNMLGKINISGNKTSDDLPNNVFLKENAVITVVGALTDSKIGVTMEAQTGTFTSGFNANHSGVSPTAVFTADMNPYLIISADAEEGTLTKKDEKAVYYIERYYDKYTGNVTTSVKTITDYVELKGGDTQVLSEGFYVVKGNVTYDHLELDWSLDQQNLILCDGATLTVDYVNLNSLSTPFAICGQRNNTGKLIANDAPSGQAGIGGGPHSWVAKIYIEGGHIIAEGGSDAAGIGAGGSDDKGQWSDFEGIYILGGIVEATGGSNAAGIGRASHVGFVEQSPTVHIFGGEVIAKGGEDGAGIGGGEGSYGIYVDIHGGTVHATGYDGAGIGGGDGAEGGHVYITGGKVYAHGDGDYFSNGAGIGGGVDGDGGEVEIRGGYVEAIGGRKGAGIGGGENGKGGDVWLRGGTVVAKAGLDDTGNRAIGPGEGNDNYGNLMLDDMLMVKSERLANAVERHDMCWYRTNVRVEPCTHPGYTADTCPYHKH